MHGILPDGHSYALWIIQLSMCNLLLQFTDEKELIISEKITPSKNPKYNTECGNATVDKVFLLNIEETSKYFKNDDARQCKPTEYAKSKVHTRMSTTATVGGGRAHRDTAATWQPLYTAAAEHIPSA